MSDIPLKQGGYWRYMENDGMWKSIHGFSTSGDQCPINILQKNVAKTIWH